MSCGKRTRITCPWCHESRLALCDDRYCEGQYGGCFCMFDPYCCSGHWSLHAMDDFKSTAYSASKPSGDTTEPKPKIKGHWGIAGLPTMAKPTQDRVLRLTAQEAKQRNDFIVARIHAGDSPKDVAAEVGLSVVQTVNIAKHWR